MKIHVANCGRQTVVLSYLLPDADGEVAKGGAVPGLAVQGLRKAATLEVKAGAVKAINRDVTRDQAHAIGEQLGRQGVVPLGAALKARPFAGLCAGLDQVPNVSLLRAPKTKEEVEKEQVDESAHAEAAASATAAEAKAKADADAAAAKAKAEADAAKAKAEAEKKAAEQVEQKTEQATGGDAKPAKK